MKKYRMKYSSILMFKFLRVPESYEQFAANAGHTCYQQGPQHCESKQIPTIARIELRGAIISTLKKQIHLIHFLSPATGSSVSLSTRQIATGSVKPLTSKHTVHQSDTEGFPNITVTFTNGA